jgi:hypothetical protein
MSRIVEINLVYELQNDKVAIFRNYITLYQLIKDMVDKVIEIL